MQKHLNTAGLPYVVNPRIVRGLDYYTRTVFEFVTTSLGAQGTVCGGGRYDGLIETLGGTPTCGVGFGMGIERVLLLMENLGLNIPKEPPVKLYIASMGDAAYDVAFSAVTDLRRNGIRAEVDHMQRGIKAQFKYADKIGAEYVTVIGDDELLSGEVKVKKMSDGSTESIKLTELTKHFKGGEN